MTKPDRTQAKKLHEAVKAAERNLDDKSAAVDEANMKLQSLKSELAQAHQALRAAKIEADSLLPPCTLVSVGWRTDKESGAIPFAILRKTPGGLIVGRAVGFDSEQRFKWNKYSARYESCAKSHFTSDKQFLRDVPYEFMPEED